MLRLTKFKRSAGVPVTATVHRIIARGNAARDRKAWGEAARAYRGALQRDPGLRHIWVQLGHALKEHGQIDDAEAAYRAAVDLRSDDADALLHLGHLFNRRGDVAMASRFYLDAFQADPAHPDAAAGLHRALARGSPAARAEMAGLLRRVLANDPAWQQPRPCEHGAGAIALAFDVSDLIQYYGGARLPTGIQRVQIEVIDTVLADGDYSVGLCCFLDGRDEWAEVPIEPFRRLAQLSVAGDDRAAPEWLTALNHLHLHLATTDPMVFRQGSTLVTLGASWNMRNYFLFVRNAKARHGIRYVPMAFDMIPVLMPEHCLPTVVQDFTAWTLGVFDHADHMLAISDSTRDDLLRVAATLGRPLRREDVTVVRLDADFRKPGAAVLPDATLARWGLDGRPYVLMVSTVEPRKGHATALDAWAMLLERHGAAALPPLVCVGGRGWLNGHVHRRLQENPALARMVLMLSGISDEELGLLYRRATFTIYPSLYEGWGLPVTESLCYGRPVIASDSSSLREAGGSLGVYVEPGSAAALAEAVERMAFDAPYRASVETAIAAGFRPRRWLDLASQIAAELVRLSRDRAEPPPPPPAQLGAYHPIGHPAAGRLWRGAGSGEVFRRGAGWGSPRAEGCWTREAGGELVVGLPASAGPVRLAVLLLGPGGGETTWRLRVRGGPELTGRIEAGERRWVMLDDVPVQPAAGGAVQLRLRGVWRAHNAERTEDEHGAVGIAGFFVNAQDDLVSWCRLVEAIATGTLAALDRYREPVPAIEDADSWSELGGRATATSSPRPRTLGSSWDGDR